MVWRRSLVVAASGLFATSAVGFAQGGGLLDARTEYQVITGIGENNQHRPLLAIVLWRGVLGWNQPHSPAEHARSDSIFRWTRLHAEEMGQSFFGSGLAYGLLDRDYRAVTIEGRRFALAAGDSALVIMVNVASDSVPRGVTTASISSELPSEFWTKHWQSGDTTFFVQPDFRRQQTILRAALVRSPAVGAFVR